jgi:hypothetical protein
MDVSLWSNRCGAGIAQQTIALLLFGLSSALVNRPAGAQQIPASPVIREIVWAESDSIVRRAKGGDNWPVTWADDDGSPSWSSAIEGRGEVMRRPGAALRSAMTYNAGIDRYLWWQQIPRPAGEADRGDTRFEGGFAIFDAPEPWGPWTTAFSTSEWDVGPGEHGDFPAKWISPDGLTLHLVFSGDDHFCVRKAQIRLHDGPP